MGLLGEDAKKARLVRFRAPFALGLLLLILCLAPGGASAGRFDPTVSRTAAGAAAARGALLEVAEIGSSWKAVRIPAPSPSAISCSQYEPNQSMLVETGLAQAGFVSGPWHNITDAVRVFATASQARISWRRTNTRSLVNCVSEFLAAQGVAIRRVGKRTFHSGAQRTTEYRIVGEMTRPPTLGKAPDLEIPVYSDVLLLSRGRTQEIIVFNSILSPFSGFFEKRIAAVAVSHLAGPIA